MKVREIVVLEAVRKTRAEVPLPIQGTWAPLKEPLKLLFKEGMLEIKNESFVISEEGKKAALLFNDSRKELIEPFEQYKTFKVNGVSIDGRLPMAAFHTKGKATDAEALEYLQNLNVFLIWEDFFKYVKEYAVNGDNWQESLLEKFELQSKYNVSIDAWKQLGRDENSAIITASKTLLPEFVQITR